MAIPRPTAWGNTNIYFLAANEGQTMPELSAMTRMGDIYEDDDITITTDEGEVLELRETGGILRDQLRQEGTVTLNLSLIGVTDEALAFWQTSVVGTGDTAKRRVQSLINNDKFAIAFYVPTAPGSDTFEAPYCTVNMTPGYASTTGWIQPIEIIILKGQADYLWDYGLVPETPPVPVG